MEPGRRSADAQTGRCGYPCDTRPCGQPVRRGGEWLGGSGGCKQANHHNKPAPHPASSGRTTSSPRATSSRFIDGVAPGASDQGATAGRLDALVERWMPEHMADYHRDLAVKHFGPGAVGSRFTVAPHPRAVLRQLLAEHPSDFDRADDRKELVAAGVGADAFLAQCRYVVVRTPGTFGLVRASALEPATPVVAVRTKVGAPCSLVVGDDAAAVPIVEVATVIFGPDMNGPDPSREVLWTMHPGYPVRPASEDRMAEGATLCAGEVIERFGDCWLQLRATTAAQQATH